MVYIICNLYSILQCITSYDFTYLLFLWRNLCGKENKTAINRTYNKMNRERHQSERICTSCNIGLCKDAFFTNSACTWGFKMLIIISYLNQQNLENAVFNAMLST